MQQSDAIPNAVLGDALEVLVGQGGILKVDDLVARVIDPEVVPNKEAFTHALIETLHGKALITLHGPDEVSVTSAGRTAYADSKTSMGVEPETVESENSAIPSIDSPYDATKVKVDFAAFPVFQIMRKLERGEIVLNPEFQRNFVWDEIRQSRLIESILIRIPLPAFYLDAETDERWLVVDGLQRLSTLDRFCNKGTLRLCGLEFLPELNGKSYSELPRRLQIQIEDNTRLTFYILQPDTPPKVKFAIFYRINTGGLVLSAQEIRHALFQGPATRILSELARSEDFLGATAGSVSPRRMDDRECVLRFLAFYLRNYHSYAASDLDGFLSDAMTELNAAPEEELSRLRSAFSRAMNNAHLLFGDYAFRKVYRIGDRRNPINKSLFEVCSVMLADQSADAIGRSKDEVLHKYLELMNSDYVFSKSISVGTGDTRSVRERFSRVEALFAEHLK